MGVFKLRWSPLILGLFIFAMTGCIPVSNYDQKTDENVTALHRKVERFFVSLEYQSDTDCGYEANISFYQEAKEEIASIKVRAEAIPNNNLTVEQIGLVTIMFGNLEQLHKIDCLSIEELQPLQAAFTSAFTAILKLELAKKNYRSR